MSWPPCQLSLVSALAVDLASVQAADQPLGGRSRAWSARRMVSSHCRVPGEGSNPTADEVGRWMELVKPSRR